MRTAILRTRPFWGILALTTCVAVTASVSAAQSFPLRDGDTWVMVGDSITAQHLHSNYFEAFCYARYPKLTFHFRNSGVGGDTIPKVLDRFAWDVAPWKPTIVSVELGMNDQGGFPVDKFIDNMGKLTAKIASIGARPILFSASPINSGGTAAKPGNNAKLAAYAAALRKFAAEQHVQFADQFRLLVDLWGNNKPRENLANLIKTAETVAHDNQIVGIEHLRTFLAEQAKDPNPPVSMQGDPVHPGPPGQLTMSTALLKDLGADAFVSRAAVDATGKLIESKGCLIEKLALSGGKLTFDRLDECLPTPIPDDARAVLPLFPAILDLSQYTLKVSGLTGGKYALEVNGTALATLTAEELAAGVNLTAYAKGPIADQGKAVLAQVAQKESLVGQWRSLSKAAALSGTADRQGQLDQVRKGIDEADARIRQAAQPRRLHFSIAPAK